MSSAALGNKEAWWALVSEDATACGTATAALPAATLPRQESAEQVVRPRRAGLLSGPVVVQLGILLASVGLVFVQLGRYSLGPGHREPKPGDPTMAQPGQIVPRAYAGQRLTSVAPVDDPERVRDLLPAGSTLVTLVKGGFVGELESAGDEQAAGRLAYAFEMRTRRTIESNDGRRIVEVRHFETRKMVKLVTGAGRLCLDFGPPQTPLLASLPEVAPEDGSVELPAATVAAAILSADSAQVSEYAASRAFVQAGSLSGKRVRITYVDGEGVESVVPLDCTLTDSELKLLFHCAVLPECYLFPGPDDTRGRSWRLDAGQLIDLVDPAAPAVPSGKFGVRSPKKTAGPGKDNFQFIARIEQAEVDLMSTRPSYGRVGLFTPSGVFRRSRDGLLERATFRGTYHAIGVSQNYFLFDEVLRKAPMLEVSYFCEPRLMGAGRGA